MLAACNVEETFVLLVAETLTSKASDRDKDFKFTPRNVRALNSFVQVQHFRKYACLFSAKNFIKICFFLICKIWNWNEQKLRLAVRVETGATHISENVEFKVKNADPPSVLLLGLHLNRAGRALLCLRLQNEVLIDEHI